MTPLISLPQRVRVMRARQRRIEIESSKSLVNYLGHTVIDSRPIPRRWGDVWEPWQGAIVDLLKDAIEQLAGLRQGYDGPRRFWITIPRGHDKTSLIGRLANFCLKYSRQQVTGYAAASDRDQAKILLSAMTRERALNYVLRRVLSAHNYEIKGPGGKVEVISSDAPSSSGYLGDLFVLDEIVYWASPALFEMILSGLIKRPQAVLIVITNAGIKGTWQWDLYQQCLADPLWKVYSTPEYRRLASWQNENEIKSDRRKMTKNHGLRVYDNVWTSASDVSLLTEDMVRACVGNPLWPRRRNPDGGHTWIVPPGRHDLYWGYDVGRSRDLSVLSVYELTGGVARLRIYEELENTPYALQKRFLRRTIDPIQHHVIAGRVDKGAIGSDLAEWAEAQWSNVRGVAMSETWQGQTAISVQNRFTEYTIEIPDDSKLIADFQQVDEIGNTKGGIPVLRTNRTQLGHADRFWSTGLAIDPMPIVGVSSGEIGIPVGTRR